MTPLSLWQGPATPLSTPVSAEHTTTSSSTASQSTAMKESVYVEMAQQLRGEKQRVTVLSSKIHELHAMEEEQRQRAHVLAEETDRYRTHSTIGAVRMVCPVHLSVAPHYSLITGGAVCVRFCVAGGG